jgi:DNA-binding response OmpR family regulator
MFPDRRTDAVQQDIKELAKAIARELLEGLRNSTVLEAAAQRSQQSGVLQVGPLTIDILRHEVTWNDQPLLLKPREFALLAFLAQNSGRAFSRQQLLDLVWPHEVSCEIESERTVDVHIRRIRVQLGQEAAQLIRTITGIGYKLQAPGGIRQ